MPNYLPSLSLGRYFLVPNPIPSTYVKQKTVAQYLTVCLTKALQPEQAQTVNGIKREKRKMRILRTPFCLMQSNLYPKHYLKVNTKGQGKNYIVNV